MESIINDYKILNKLKEFESILLKVKIICIFGENGNDVLVVLEDDSVYAYGRNKEGCLGLGNCKTISKPTAVSELCGKRIFSFSHGFQHILALSEKGEIFSWGGNRWGQLGNGSNTDNHRPENIKHLKNKFMVEICCGSYHSMALTKQGILYAWGKNDDGQIGHGCHDDLRRPVKVIGFETEKVISISCGENHSLALTQSGHVFFWGNSFESPQKINLNVIRKEKKFDMKFEKISCGSNHSLLLSREGFVYNLEYFEDENQYQNDGHQEQYKINLIENHIKFVDIETSIYSDIRIGLSQEDQYYIWGKCGEEEISSPRNVTLKLFRHIFAKCSSNQISHKAINISGNSEIAFKCDDMHFGKYRREFAEYGLIAFGTFGVVFKAKNKINEKLVAIKKIPFIKNFDYSCFENFSNLPNNKREYIVDYNSLWIEENYLQNEKNYINSIKTDEQSLDHVIFDPYIESLIHIQMEFCRHSLFEIMNLMKYNYENKVNEIINPIRYFLSCQLLKQILEAVNYLHNQNPPIIHRNLKPTNILVTNGENGRFIKLSGLGFITTQESDEQSHKLDLGTPYYTAPEIFSNNLIQNSRYNTKADIYSLGVIMEKLFELSTNRFVI
jgi:RCC1 and BTB domain-containing protein